MKTLRIVFTVISAIFIALVIPVGALHSWPAAILCALGAFLFIRLRLRRKHKPHAHDRRARHDDLSDLHLGEDGRDGKDDKGDGNKSGE